MIDDSLGFTVKVFGCFMPEDHSVYGLYMRSMCNITIQELIKELDCVQDTEMCSKLCHHVVPLVEDLLESQSLFPTMDIGDRKTVTCLVQKMKYQPAV